MHHPLYSHATGFSGHGSDEQLQAAVGPLLDRYGVDLVLAGHDHHYERSHPVRAGEPVEPGCGPVYVLTGGGGASRFARSVQRSKLTVSTSTSHQFVRLVVRRAVIQGIALGTQGEVIDQFAVRAYEGPDAGDPRCGPSAADGP
jgi:3',5'-cyclic AMP phosphodiesterase CpdA